MNHLAEKVELLEITLGERTVQLGVEKFRKNGKDYFNYIQYLSNGRPRYVAKKSDIQPKIMRLLVENNYQRRNGKETITNHTH